MPPNITHVNPGDLITATFINSILDELDSLQSQLDALGTVSSPPSVPGLPPTITGLNPTGPVPAGSELDIQGRNFAVPAVLNTVTLGTRTISEFELGSTDRLLKIGVPADLAPDRYTLSVATAAGSASRDVDVSAPFDPLVGQVEIAPVTGNLGTINVGQQYTFHFELNGEALNLPEQYRISAQYQNAQGATGAAWDAATTYTGTTGTDHQITVDPAGGTVSVGVVVTVPTGATRVDLQLKATSVHNDPASSNTSNGVPIVIGQAPLPSDPAITLTPGTNSTANLQPGTIDGEPGFNVRYGHTVVLTIDGQFDDAGTYDFAASVENPDTSIWTIGPVVPTSKAFASPVPTPSPHQQIQVQVQLVPTTAPAQSVARQFLLTATRRETTGPGQISNFIRFPIGGFGP